MQRYVIHQGPTRAWISTDTTPDVIYAVNNFLAQNLTEFEQKFDPRIRRMMTKVAYTYYRLDQKEKRMYIPRYFAVPLKTYLGNMLSNTTIEIETYGGKTDLPKLGTSPNPDFPPKKHKGQPEVIDHLAQYVHGNIGGMFGTELQTGVGKTYCTIQAATRVDEPWLVAAGSKNLLGQWKKEIVRFTTVEEDEVVIVEGYQKLVRLAKSIVKPKVIIFSLATLRLFALRAGRYAELPFTLDDFCKYFNIGTKVFDECHLNFHAYTMVDLACDIQRNIYLSATYWRSNKNTQRIFSQVYPQEILLKAGKYNKYVQIMAYAYSMRLNPRLYTRHKGYCKFKYEAETIKNERRFPYWFKFLNQAYKTHFENIRNEGEKCVIFVATKEAIRIVADEFRKRYPHRVVLEYHGDIPPEHLHRPENEIIVTTIGSAGTGTDIHNLRTCINAVSFKADSQLVQLLGRLRELANGVVPHMVDLYNIESEDHVRHFKERQRLYRKLAKNYDHQRMTA